MGRQPHNCGVWGFAPLMHGVGLLTAAGGELLELSGGPLSPSLPRAKARN